MVTQTIKASDTLKELQAKVAQEELERASKAESNNLFQKLVDHDPNLAGLLSSRDPTIRFPSAGGGNAGKDSGSSEFKGQFSPTFVLLEEKLETKGLEIPSNRGKPLGARTDAENGYLQRANYPGRVLLDQRVRENFSVREHLKDGRLTIYLSPIEGKLKSGETIKLRVGMRDDAMAEAVQSEEVIVKIVEAEAEQKDKKQSKDKQEKKSGDAKNQQGNEESAPTLGLPRCVLLTADGSEITGYSTEKWPYDSQIPMAG